MPGSLLLHPASLLALGLLVLNDHWLKSRFGNVLTGKLSDIAGVFFFPLLLVSLLEIARWARGRIPWAWRRQELSAAIAVTFVGLSAIKLVPAAGSAYVYGMGGAQWLVGAAAGMLSGDGVPTYHRVHLVRDPGDLLALPVLGLSVALAIYSQEAAGQTD